ncbi:MAG: N-acetylmuramoyl-L-alanine amidase [Myxococcaceae bacterium]|nr:N-acetylmuramoyl-L-alanine amidase [Myxococcaceae bacterium]
MLALVPALLALASGQLGFAEDCGLEPPGAPIAPVPRKPRELPWRPGEGASVRRERPETLRVGSQPTAHQVASGALSGKTVYLSAGHGFTWTQAVTAWRTQRPTTNAIVEDLVSTETVHQLLVPMLLNAGAQVFTVRESDLNPNLVVVDDGTAGYQEVGTATLFSDSTVAGWGQTPVPLPDGTNPFSLGKNRLMAVAASATASARYTAAFPADGFYNAYVSFAALSSRVTDAHYVVHHAGGETHFRVNQRRHGSTWVLLGRFYFRKGSALAVEVLNDSKDTGTVSLDAVRFGGGMGVADRGGGRSGRPRFEECSRYHAHYAGAPTSVYDARVDDPDDDVVTRSRFSAWVHEPGEDAVYLAWHTNAFNAAAVGTDIYVYGPNPPDGTYQFTGVPGSDKLAQYVHGELINDIKASAGWNQPSWNDRGIHSAYFGEINPTHNDEMPGILMEIAFHDAAADATHLKEPAFRYLAARAIAQGIVRYFADKDGAAPQFSPEPPTEVSAVNTAGGKVRVSWKAPAVDGQGVGGAAAKTYRVYQSADGLGWDEGVPALGTSLELTLPSGAARYFRVTALNDGGESFPSVVVGARAPLAGYGTALLVSAFDRLEAAMARSDDLSAYTLGNVLRIILPRLNDGALLRRPGEALDAAKVGFDGASSDAVASGAVKLDGYALVGWFSGRGHSASSVLNAAERTALTTYAQSGKPLLVTGATAARLLAAGAAEDKGALSSVLRAQSAGSTAQLQVVGSAGEFLEGIPGLALDDGTQGSSDTGASDVLAAQGAAAVVARRPDGGAAGVAADHALVYLGFPFESVTSRPARLDVMARVLDYFGLRPDAGPDVPDAGPELPDAGAADAGLPDGGQLPIVLPAISDVLDDGHAKGGCGCATSGPGLVLLAVAALSRRRFRR